MASTAPTKKGKISSPAIDLPENTRLNSLASAHQGNDLSQYTQRALESSEPVCKCKCKREVQKEMRQSVRDAINVQADWLPSAKRLLWEMKTAQVVSARLMLKMMQVKGPSAERNLAEKVLGMVVKEVRPFPLMEEEYRQLEWFVKITKRELTKEIEEFLKHC